MFSKKVLRSIIITEVLKLLGGKHHLGIYAELWSVSECCSQGRRRGKVSGSDQGPLQLCLLLHCPKPGRTRAHLLQGVLFCSQHPPWIWDAGSHILAYSLCCLFMDTLSKFVQTLLEPDFFPEQHIPETQFPLLTNPRLGLQDLVNNSSSSHPIHHLNVYVSPHHTLSPSLLAVTMTTPALPRCCLHPAEPCLNGQHCWSCA